MLVYRDLIDSETLRNRFKSATHFRVGNKNVTVSLNVYIYIYLMVLYNNILSLRINLPWKVNSSRKDRTGRALHRNLMR